MILIVGIGNPYRSDEWIGCYATRVLEDKFKGKDIEFLVTSHPEAYIERIANMNPDRILIISSLDLGLDPGKIKVIDTARMRLIKGAALRVLVDFLKNRTKAIVSVIGVQPKNTSFGRKLSTYVESSIPEIEKKIREFLK